MKDGETARFDCENCNVEFEVTLEPKAKGLKGHKPGPEQKVIACPFCAEESSFEDD